MYQWTSYFKLILALLYLLPLGLKGQQRLITHNARAWYNMMWTKKLTKQWSLQIDGQIRIHNVVDQLQFWYLHTGVVRHLTPNLNMSAAVLTQTVLPSYNRGGVRFAFPEYRTYEQVRYGLDIEKQKLWMRHRLEQRWIGATNAEGQLSHFNYFNRLRNLVRLEIPLNTDHSNYLALTDELFLQSGPLISWQYYDQNRLSLAYGFKVTPWLRIESGYLWQNSQSRNPDPETGLIVAENNHVWLTTLFFNTDLSQLLSE